MCWLGRNERYARSSREKEAYPANAVFHRREVREASWTERISSSGIAGTQRVADVIAGKHAVVEFTRYSHGGENARATVTHGRLRSEVRCNDNEEDSDYMGEPRSAPRRTDRRNIGQLFAATRYSTRPDIPVPLRGFTPRQTENSRGIRGRGGPNESRIDPVAIRSKLPFDTNNVYS